MGRDHYYLHRLHSVSFFNRMPNIKIYYADFPFWRAEVSRLALHLGKVPFEDCRVSVAEIKEGGKSPFGQAPFLEVDGKALSQTGAIARYCGKLSGHYPKNDDFAAAKVDEIIDVATDMTIAVGRTFKMEAEEKTKARAELASTILPKYLAALEKIFTQNGSTGFYVGGTMTIADIAMWRMLGWLNGGIVDGLPTSLLEPYPQVEANMKSTGAQPEIAAWMEKHYSPKK